MNSTEAAVSGTISIVILVLATLKRSGLLDKAWEVLKERLKRRKVSDAKDKDAIEDPRKEAAPFAPPVSELRSYLERLAAEQDRLDAEFNAVHNFLMRKKEKIHEPG